MSPRRAALPLALGLLAIAAGAASPAAAHAQAPPPVDAQAPPVDAEATPEPSAPPSTLTVQRRWELLAVGVAVPDDLSIRPLLVATTEAIERELPGLEVRFDLGAWQSFPAPAPAPGPAADAARADDRALVRYGLREAEASGLDVAAYDVVFVFSPLYRGRYFGFSYVAYRTADGRAARGAAIQTEPARLVHAGIARELAAEDADREGDGADPDPDPDPEPAEAEPAPRRISLRGLARGLWERAADPLAAALSLPGVREAILAPTIAHELGHFFGPGDLDIKDGYAVPWMRHAAGPDDNPEGHGVECCMYKGRSLGFYAKKVLAMRGRVVVFCDACRTRLGCAPPGSDGDGAAAPAPEAGE